MHKPYIHFVFVLAFLFAARLLIGSTISLADESGKSSSKYFDLSSILRKPGELEFAGERVPLERKKVWEHFDKELHLNACWESNVRFLLRKATIYLPIIEPILRKNGIPDDFKYLPLVESGFKKMKSYAGAEGHWQFMRTAALKYGLEINNEVDERYELERSTEAACRYIRDAYKVFHNWTMVAASYNCGTPSLKHISEREKSSDFYSLSLNEQTSRYVIRIIAIKEILEHPGRYGVTQDKPVYCQKTFTYKVDVNGSIPDLAYYARTKGVTFNQLKEYNPWLKGYSLLNPHKHHYVLSLPVLKDAHKKEIEQQWQPVYLSASTAGPSYFLRLRDNKQNLYLSDCVKKVLPDLYRVNRGEDINFVAQRFGVSIVQVMYWNNLETPSLQEGQVLKLYCQTD